MVRIFFLFCFLVLGVSNAFSNKAEVWQIFADYKTDEVLAVNFNVFNWVEIDHGTRIYYSTNNGKYIPMTVESFSKLNEITPQMIAFFPAKPAEKYTITLVNYAACGTHLACKNPDGSEQEFYPTGNDSASVPTAQYGRLLLGLDRPSEDYAVICTDQKTSETLALIKVDHHWHLLYRSSPKAKYIEMEMTSTNPANASFVAVFPNNKAKKYKMRYLSYASAGASSTLEVHNPDHTVQTFYINLAEMSESGLMNKKKSPAGLYLELLGK